MGPYSKEVYHNCQVIHDLSACGTEVCMVFLIFVRCLFCATSSFNTRTGRARSWQIPVEMDLNWERAAGGSEWREIEWPTSCIRSSAGLSVLGPLLFIIYVDGVESDGIVVMFADDMVLYTPMRITCCYKGTSMPLLAGQLARLHL